MRTLRGHSNWVKNIEFVKEEGLLVTSGFDGCVFTWDINNYTEQGTFHKILLYFRTFLFVNIYFNIDFIIQVL